MIIDVFAMIASAFAQFFSIYSALDFALQISAYAVIAIAMWSITRFLVLPILGGHYSVNDGDTDILTESVTETRTTSSPVRHENGKTIRHNVTRTSSRTFRKRVKR